MLTAATFTLKIGGRDYLVAFDVKRSRVTVTGGDASRVYDCGQSYVSSAQAAKWASLFRREVEFPQ